MRARKENCAAFPEKLGLTRSARVGCRPTGARRRRALPPAAGPHRTRLRRGRSTRRRRRRPGRPPDQAGPARGRRAAHPRRRRAALAVPPRPPRPAARLDAHVVVEPEADGVARLRFGDGVTGRAPPARPTFPARVPARRRDAPGNVGAGRLTHWLLRADGSAGGPPAPQLDGVEPAGRRPAAPTPSRWSRSGSSRRPRYRRQLRAVTAADYAVVAEPVAGRPAQRRTSAVDRLLVRRRRSPSTRVAARADDPALPLRSPTLLEVRRMAGVDVEVRRPVYVPLLVRLVGCVPPGYLARGRRAQLLDVLSARAAARRRARLLPPGPVHLRPAALPQRRRRRRDGGARARLGRGDRVRPARPTGRGDRGQPRARAGSTVAAARGAALRHRPEQPRGRPGRHRARGVARDRRAADRRPRRRDREPARPARLRPAGRARTRSRWPGCGRGSPPPGTTSRCAPGRRRRPTTRRSRCSTRGRSSPTPCRFYSERIANEGFLRTATRARVAPRARPHARLRAAARRRRPGRPGVHRRRPRRAPPR